MPLIMLLMGLVVFITGGITDNLKEMLVGGVWIITILQIEILDRL
mgnify:CR=1 FL=1